MRLKLGYYWVAWLNRFNVSYGKNVNATSSFCLEREYAEIAKLLVSFEFQISLIHRDVIICRYADSIRGRVKRRKFGSESFPGPAEKGIGEIRNYSTR